MIKWQESHDLDIKQTIIAYLQTLWSCESNYGNFVIKLTHSKHLSFWKNPYSSPFLLKLRSNLYIKYAGRETQIESDYNFVLPLGRVGVQGVIDKHKQLLPRDWRSRFTAVTFVTKVWSEL